MKNNRVKILFSLCVLTALVQLRLFAQATFSMRNYDSTAGVDAPVYDWTGRLLSGPNWRAELYGGVEASSLTPLFNSTMQSPHTLASLIAPGYFVQSTDGELSVVSVPPYGWAWLQLKVWDTELGPTFEAAVAQGVGGFGQSAVFYARGGDPTASPPTLPGPLIGLTSFSVSQVVPEPAIALLLLAGLPVFWWRGRKSRCIRPVALSFQMG